MPLLEKNLIFPQPYYKDVGSDGKESACNAGDLGLIPGLGTSPGTAIHSYWRIPAWQATVHRVSKSQTKYSTQHYKDISDDSSRLRDWEFIKN